MDGSSPKVQTLFLKAIFPQFLSVLYAVLVPFVINE
jgi:hypothetical protein